MSLNCFFSLSPNGFMAIALLWLLASTKEAVGVTPSSQEASTAREWIASSFLGDGPYPFNFMFGGRQSAELLSTWGKQLSSRELDATQRRHELTLTDPASGLQVKCLITEYRDFPAAEWVLYFTNTGSGDTPILHNILPLNTEFANSVAGAPFDLRYALGSHERSDDFRLFETRASSPAETMTFTSFGGRSSDGYLPFFNLMKSSGGLMLGIGWTGQWTACFRYAESRRMSVRAGMEYTHLKLHPNEEIRTPAILVVFWDGNDTSRGHNLLRALLREHYTPRPGGKPLQLPLAISAHGTYPFEGTTAENMVAAIQRVAQFRLPFDTWWIDTGWFELVNNDWARSVGNVDPDPSRYPNGLRPVADAAHRNGMKFLLWFEPERVMPHTRIYKEYPQWLIAPPSDLPYEITYMLHDGFHLLDLGNPAARQWLTEYTIKAIDEMTIDIYRHDFNMFPSYYWRYQEPEDRQGMREIRYVMGLYQFWDDLLEKYPELLIDNCASGGRRIDFEMLRRSVVLFRSDVAFRNPTASQCMTHALSHWLPFHGLGTTSSRPYHFRSGLGSVFVVAANLNGGEERWSRMNHLISQYVEIRHLFEGDFYALSPYDLNDNQDIAWQFDRPELGEGIIQVFRREKCELDKLPVKLRGLAENSDYVLFDVDRPESSHRLKGRHLMTEGVTVALPERPYAALYRYHRVKDRRNKPSDP